MTVGNRPNSASHTTAEEATQMNRKSTMRSFTWEPQDGDEISACPDCCHCWHVLFHVDYDEDSMTSTVTVREWHEAECPIWKDPEADG